MGLIGKIGELRMKDPVEGELVVAGVSMPDADATSQNYRIEGVVSGPGITPQAVVHRGVVSTGKWPSIGDHLPVTVDRAKPERMIVHWDRLSTGVEQARSRAEQLAAQMRGEVPPPGARAPAAGQYGSGVTVNYAPGSQTMDPEALKGLLAMAFGQAGGAQSQPGAAAQLQSVGGMPAMVVSAADILARGTPGFAVVNGVFPSGLPSPKPAHTLMGLQLSVTVAGRPAFPAANQYAVPDEKVPLLRVGGTLPVRVDDSMTGLVAVDWAAVA